MAEPRIDQPKPLELFGIMMGDGCLSQYRSNYDNRIRKVALISGNLVKDYEYMKNHVQPIVKEMFNLAGYLQHRKSTNTINLVITSSKVFNWFNKNKFPVGRKGQITIPEHIENLSLKNVNNVIRGLFDTDGCISARKDENYQYPYILISANSALRDQLKYLLNRQGINAYIHGYNVVVRGNRNCSRWFELIGSNNPRNLSHYNHWKENKKVPVIPKGR